MMSKHDSGKNEWVFLNGEWSRGVGGELAPPDGTDVEYMAVKEGVCYGDFTATFRYRLRTMTSVRFLFRLQDSRRFYALDIPCNGQQFRARTFWAGIVVADGSPLQRYLNFGLVPGLCARLEHWYEVKVEAKGTSLRAWIDGVLVADVQDNTYASGRVGLASIQNPYIDAPRFDGFQIEGDPLPASEGFRLEAPSQHWITPCPEPDPTTYQSYAQLMQGKSGEVVLFLTFGNPNWGETRRSVFIRSRDGGRTWGASEPSTLQAGFGGSFVREDGTWVCIHSNHSTFKWQLYAYESVDEGRSWKTPYVLDIDGGWPAEWRVGGAWTPVRMRDGSIVVPVMCALANEPVADSQCPFYAAMVIRSRDDGRTWSAPVLCDASNKAPGEPVTPLRYAGRYYEVAMDEGDEGTIVGIGRPDRDPYMWRLQSNDGGRSWEPAAIGHFPGFCPSLTATASGALVATVRYPYFAAYLSWDGGRTWGPPVIVDYCAWANQRALEVEPDVVLVTYMGEIMDPGKADSRIARLKVTDQGLVLDH